MKKFVRKNCLRKVAVIIAALIMTVTGSIAVSGLSASAEQDGETGYDLWLRYRSIENGDYRASVNETLLYIVAPETDSEVICSAKNELKLGLDGMLGRDTLYKNEIDVDGALFLGTKNSEIGKKLVSESKLNSIPKEGYIIKSADFGGKKTVAVIGADDRGALYGAFRLLEMVQCRESLSDIAVEDAPKIQWRVLDQWDNWKGTIERGYAGASIYNWSALPGTVDARYEDFARANASVGINTIVINNVNTQTDYIKPENLPKVAAIADVFRKYGIRLALTVRFDSPIALGGLSSSDPLSSTVISWWDDKFDEIYSAIPDFAGVLVKADSEGQPGPSKYGRTHADGANMFSEILKKHNDAIVMWRAFVYGAVANQLSSDIVNQAYEFFKPLDGEFNDNVIVQSKNGPRDFLPREPVSPLFGGMTKTNMGLEVQITQEYTGQSTHLCYLVPMWKAYLDTDMMVTADGPDTSEGTTLKRIVDGTVYRQNLSLMAGVANIGSDENWTRLELAQANWYGFGKLAWNPDASQDEITHSWIKKTFGCDKEVINVIGKILSESWDTYQAYTSPYSMGMTFDVSTHFSSALEYRNSKGTINIDKDGIGNNRNSTGTGLNTDATAQYSEQLGAIYNDIDTCPEELLFWFHHVPYTYVMSNGKTMIENFYGGVTAAKNNVLNFKVLFGSLEGKIDNNRFNGISASFGAQLAEAVKWEQAMKSYVSEISGIPSDNLIFTNLALNKTAYASQTRKDWSANKAFDGVKYTDGSRWATEQRDECHYIFVDLGEIKTVNRVELYWENFSKSFVIETAESLSAQNGSVNSDWTVAATGCGNEWSSAAYGRNDTSVLFADTRARYVRMRTLEKSSSLWNSLYEMEVYGDEFVKTARYMLETEIYRAAGFGVRGAMSASVQMLKDNIENAQNLLVRNCTDKNLLLSAYNSLKDSFNEMSFEDIARNKKARRTTVNGSNHAGNAVDGDGATFWRPSDSDSSPALTVDFGRVEKFDRIEIGWKIAPLQYKLEVRNAETENWAILKVVENPSVKDVVNLAQTAEHRQLRLTIVSRAQTETSVYDISVYNSSAATALEKEELRKAYEGYKNTEREKYTARSYDMFLTALDAVEKTLADESASVRMTESVFNYLDNAYYNLTDRGNVKLLKENYESAAALNPLDYTRESYDSFKLVLDGVLSILNDENALSEQTENALSSLEKGVGLLVRTSGGQQQPTEDNGIPGWGIALIVCGSVAVAGCVGGAVFVILRKKRKI